MRQRCPALGAVHRLQLTGTGITQLTSELSSMRSYRVTALAGIIGLILVLSACADGPMIHTRPASHVPSSSAPINTIKPTYAELPLASSADTSRGEPVPWTLIKVDRARDHIYLSATGSDCVIPRSVSLKETSTSITVAVVGSPNITDGSACTEQRVTLIGYVTSSDPIGGRTITGNSV